MDISLIVSILFKIYDEAKERLLIKSKKYEEGRNNFKKLIEEIISLIDDFVLSVDIILKFLNELYPDVSLPNGLDYSHPRGAYNYSSAEFLSLNRKLLELHMTMQNKLRIIEKYHTSKNFRDLEKILKVCLQIVNIEGFIGVRLANSLQLDVLPIPCDEMDYNYMHDRQKGRLTQLPIESSNIHKYILNELIYFHNLLLRLKYCKEELSFMSEMPMGGLPRE